MDIRRGQDLLNLIRCELRIALVLTVHFVTDRLR